MFKKIGYIALALTCVLTLSACKGEDKGSNENPSESTQQVGKEVSSKKASEVTIAGQDLFSQLINVESLKSEEEFEKSINSTLVNPDEYKDSLKKNNIKLDFGRYLKARAAHRDINVRELSNGNYLFHSFATVDMYMTKDQAPVSSPFEVSLELKYDKGAKSYKIAKADIQPQ